ncbi:MAG: hypothetical protein PV345_05955 [Wolbachia sp.]|nr:hypothetical protein [Wolbachia sp.]
MNNIPIYLIGFPGGDKFTIAKELCKIINATVSSNNLWKKIFEVRQHALEILSKYYIKSKHYIFTNELIEDDSYDYNTYN